MRCSHPVCCVFGRIVPHWLVKVRQAFSHLYLFVKSDIRIQKVGWWQCLVEVTFQRIVRLPQDRCWWCLLYRVLLEKPWTVPLCSVSNGSLLPRQKLVHITSILLQLAPGQDILKNTISWHSWLLFSQQINIKQRGEWRRDNKISINTQRQKEAKSY